MKFVKDRLVQVQFKSAGFEYNFSYFIKAGKFFSVKHLKNALDVLDNLAARIAYGTRLIQKKNCWRIPLGTSREKLYKKTQFFSFWVDSKPLSMMYVQKINYFSGKERTRVKTE